jgi:HK97 family phage prohead protease
MANLERRTISGTQVRAVDSNNALSIEGRAAAYNVLSQDLGFFRERLSRGAFANVVKRGDDVACLFNHDVNKILGRTISGTLKLTDGPEGLDFHCDLPPTQTARDIHASIQRGDISGCSFSFALNPSDEEWSEMTDPLDRSKRIPIRTVKNITKLFDVGPVLHPAYNIGTNVDARSLELMRNTPPGPLVIARFKVPTDLKPAEEIFYENIAFEGIRQRRKNLLNQIMSS